MGNYTHTLKYGWFTTRSYIVHTPANYDSKKKYPVVVSMHGFLGDGAVQQDQTQMDKEADVLGYITVYPDGVGRSWNCSDRCCGYSNARNIDDVGFIRDVMTDVGRKYSVDEKKRYAVGMSNGGMMAYSLAINAPDVFAAIGVNAGSMDQIPSRPIGIRVPVIHFHGEDDTNMPINGGPGTGLGDIDFNSLEEASKFFIMNNNLDATSPVVEETGDYTKITFNANDEPKAPFVAYLVKRHGHEWPGGVRKLLWVVSGPLNSNVNASRLMLEFFSNYTR